MLLGNRKRATVLLSSIWVVRTYQSAGLHSQLVGEHCLRSCNRRMNPRRSRHAQQARALLANEPAATTTSSLPPPPPGVALHAWIKAQSKTPAARLSTRNTLLDASMFQRLMVANLQLGSNDQPTRRRPRQQQRVTCSRCGALQSSMGGLNAGCQACGERLALSTNARAFAEVSSFALPNCVVL